MHVAGIHNVTANALSHNKEIWDLQLSIDAREWSLHTEVVTQVFTLLGTPKVDMFASVLNRKLPGWLSWY